MTITTYEVRVVGMAWGGFRASLTLVFPVRPARADVARRAGGFRQVDWARTTLRRVTRTVAVEGHDWL